MQIVIDIPEEFGIEIENRFQDFFKRLEAETKNHMISGSNLVCGAYELETIDMFLKAFNNGTPLPKGHGRLIDADAVLAEPIGNTYKDIEIAETIIEADKAESEDKE